MSASGTFSVYNDGTEEGELIDVGVACEEPMERASPRKRGGQKRKAKTMDHSGLQEIASTAASVHINDEPQLCRPIMRGLTERSSHEKVAYELARCLHEVSFT